MQAFAEVIKLDRGLPLILIEGSDAPVRAEFCARMSKKKQALTIGDRIEVALEEGLDNAVINKILKPKTKLVRNDPVNRSKEQILAANFDRIAICVVAAELNFNHLCRVTAVAKNAGVPVDLILTKCDLGSPNLSEISEIKNAFEHIYLAKIDGLSATLSRLPNGDGGEFSCGKNAAEIGDGDNFSRGKNAASIGDGGEFAPAEIGDGGKFSTEPVALEELFAGSRTTILIGKSGAGKSSLINAMAGEEVCKPGEVREFDDKGRHTTVSREIVVVNAGKPSEKRVVDMPGVRSIGMIHCEKGIRETFQEIEEASHNCKFRDCTHNQEPGCAVKATVSERSLKSYHELVNENDQNSNPQFR
ncbi:MAG: ribosome small subunit-dependent GTPase A [Phoenicibacter congonensis]|uniref:Ribosome small subunit-dependent GTPase A n=1 Tax=Phoenicibacter congonensis TaxID=1944646 RepID=A0AA43U8L3_9ACTN|nr:ribosome small subunit-dependent GTPase A [Phoenicibacter congonensis]